LKRSFQVIALLLSLSLLACQTGPAPVSISPPLSAPTATPTAAPSPTAGPTHPPAVAATLTPTVSISATVTPPPDTPAAASTEDEIAIGLVGELKSLNPLADLNLTLSQISPLLYQTLSQLDPATAQPSPYLATLPAISTNGLTLTYQLTTAVFSLADVKASIETAIWPELTDIQAVTAAGSETLTVSLSQPNCPLVDWLGQLPILAQTTVTSDRPLGSGPFKLSRWYTATNTLHFAPNTRLGAPSPRLKGITVRLFEDDDAAWAALQGGELDLLLRRAPPGDLPAGYSSLAYPAPLLLFISFNNQDEILVNPLVRQALSLAIDRNHLLSKVFNQQGDLAKGPLHPGHWAADPTLPVPPYDPAQAASLLDRANLTDRNGDGWRDRPDGKTWKLAVRVRGDDQLQSAIAFIVADHYRQLGIQARAELAPQGVILDDFHSHDYQTAVYGLTIWPALNDRSQWHSDQIEAELGLNLSAYANPEVDIWLDEANHLPGCTPAGRKELYRQIQAELVADRPYDFLIIPYYFLIARETIQGLAPGPFAAFTWNVSEWHIEHEK